MQCSRSWCDNEATEGFRQCVECRHNRRINRQANVQSRYERGLCIDCPSERDANSVRCAACRWKNYSGRIHDVRPAS